MQAPAGVACGGDEAHRMWSITNNPPCRDLPGWGVPALNQTRSVCCARLWQPEAHPEQGAAVLVDFILPVRRHSTGSLGCMAGEFQCGTLAFKSHGRMMLPDNEK